ncbi:MAG: hypothetical protein MJE68_08125, partial [Proteobacteria bacterium]|nr:hypothetical protein [Pseudomonadota bacterium]
MTRSEQEIDTNAKPAEFILRDIVSGCAEDRDGVFYDEYGGGVCPTTGNLSQATSSPEKTSEEIMSLQEFIGDDDDPSPFVVSQEDSDGEQDDDFEKPCHSGDEITEIPERFNITPRKKKAKYSKTFQNYRRLSQLEVEMVNKPPWDVDGDHHYKILCDEDSWVDKQKDGRWWVMTTSSRLGLQGKRKVGSCRGSRICQNVDCPKLQSEGVCNINPKDFVSENGAFVCKSCGYYAVEIYCGCRKVTEYNKQTQELDVWYEGEHNCTPKPDIASKRNFFESLPLRHDLRLTPTELRNDCVRFFMSTGNFEKAKEVAFLLNDKDALEKMRFLQPGGKATHYCMNISEAFEIIGKMKTELDKIDKFLIYAFNCGKTSTGESFVFKTSAHHLETALKMDETRRPLSGKRSILSFEKAYFDGMHS